MFSFLNLLFTKYSPFFQCIQYRGSPPYVFLKKAVLKKCSKFTGERPHGSAISELQSNLIEITLPYGCSTVNLLHIFRTSLYKNTLEGLLLSVAFAGRYWKALKQGKKLIRKV